jgi:glycosyltransferase involved in cell wall biosynthesis
MPSDIFRRVLDVSIIIPTYNRATLLERAIDSCRHVRNGPLSVEIIVVDDASTDGTRKWLHGTGPPVVPVLLTRNGGQCNARNAGLERARGRWLKFLDSDDQLVPGTLSQEVALATRTGADIVVCGWGTCIIDDHGRRVQGSEAVFPPPVMDPRIDAVLAGRAVPTSAALYRRAYVDGLQWDPEVKKLDDWDWFVFAALRGGSIEALEHTSYWMCTHPGGRVTTSATMLLNARDHHRVLLKLERTLAQRGELTLARRARLAQYYYKELRVLSLHDRPAFTRAAAHILELDPEFSPRDEEQQAWMRALAHAIGFRRAVQLHSAIKSRLFTRGTTCYQNTPPRPW